MKFYLDGKLYENPIGWNSISERIYYSPEITGYLKEIDGKLDWYGSAFNYFKNIASSGFCSEVEIIILDNCADGNEVKIFQGKIVVSDIEFDLVKCVAKTELIDNSFVSRIDNNKAIRAIGNVTRSKNDFDISAYSNPQTNISLLRSDGTAGIVNASGFRIYDAFKFIIGFISDGEIDFKSDYFNPAITTDETAAYTVIMSGVQIRTGLGQLPYYSFEDIFSDVNKIFNISFTIEYNNERPVIRIEPKSYFEQYNEINYFNNPTEIIQTIPQDQLYSKVIFGSSKIAGTFNFLQDIKFLGQQQEEYHLPGQCNTSAQLDLQLKQFITDTNIIQDLVDNGTNESYDKDNFFIVLNSSNVSVLSNRPSSINFFYNEGINNLAVSLYHLGSIPQSLVSYLGNPNDEFMASLTTIVSVNNFVTGDIIIYNDDSTSPNNDVNGNYNNANGRYIAPSDGTYAFFTHNIVTSTSPISPQLNTLSFKRYNSLNVLQQTYNVESGIPLGSYQTYILNDTVTMLMYAGDYVVVNWRGAVDIQAGSYFSCIQAVNGGGYYQTYNEKQVRIINNRIDYNISCDKWEEIKSTPFKTFLINFADGNNQNQTIKGWLKEISRNITTGASQVTLNSKPSG